MYRIHSFQFRVPSLLDLQCLLSEPSSSHLRITELDVSSATLINFSLSCFSLRLANRRKKKGPLDIFHKVESGGKSVTILKLPKRLRVLFFWADTRMVQRLLMVSLLIFSEFLLNILLCPFSYFYLIIIILFFVQVCMIIWIAILMYSDPFGNKRHSSVNKGPEMRIRTGPPVPPIHSKESNVPDFDSKKV